MKKVSTKEPAKMHYFWGTGCRNCKINLVLRRRNLRKFPNFPVMAPYYCFCGQSLSLIINDNYIWMIVCRLYAVFYKFIQSIDVSVWSFLKTYLNWYYPKNFFSGHWIFNLTKCLDFIEAYRIQTLVTSIEYFDIW